MATLAELDFKVILDDKEFNQKVKDVEEAAKQLNANLTQILDLKNKIKVVSDDDVKNAKNIENILSHRNQLRQKELEYAKRLAQTTAQQNQRSQRITERVAVENKEAETRATIKTAMAQERLNQLRRQGEKGLLSNTRLWREMGTLAAGYFSINGAANLIKSLVRVSAEFELQKTTLAAILQDTERAAQLYEQIKDLAVMSPFSFKELATYAKQLSAYSIPVAELYDTTKMLADVSAGLGVGMDRLVLAYGQIRSAAFLRGTEVRQLTEAGIPILEELRKKFIELGEAGTTAGDVFDKISKRLVPFEMVEEVFKSMTSEGGKFYEMQEIQAVTLKGKISNLTDAYQIMFSEIGDKHSGFLKGSVDLARSLAENYEKVGRAIVSLVALVGAYKAALIAKQVWQSAEVLAMTKGIGAITKFGKATQIAITQTNLFAAAQRKLSIINENKYMAIAAAVFAVGAAFVSTQIHAAKFRQELEEIASSKMNKAREMAEDYSRLTERINEANEGTQDYRDAISEINKKYGEYLPNLLTEKNALDEVAKAHGRVTNAIYAQQRAYAESEGMQKIEDEYGKDVGQYALNMSKYMQKHGFAKDSAQSFVQSLRQAFLDAGVDTTAHELSELFQEKFAQYYGEDVKNPFLNLDPEVYQSYVTRYAEAVRGMKEAMEDFNDAMDAEFGSSSMYSVEEERRRVEEINAAYEQEKNALDKTKMSLEEYNKALKLLDYSRLTKLIALYESLNNNKYPGMFVTKIKELKDLRDGADKDLGWIQKIVNPLAGEGSNRDLRAAEGDNLAEYVDRMRKEYKSVSEAIKDSKSVYDGLVASQKKGDEISADTIEKSREQYELDKKRKETIEAIGRALNISVNDKITTKKSGGKSQEQIDLEKRRDTIKDMMSWYSRLISAGMGDEEASTFLSSFFPTESTTAKARDFKNALLEIADALQKYDEKAAQSLRDDVASEGLDKIFDAFKAKMNYEKEIQNWLAKDFGLEEGATFKISSIISARFTDDKQTGIEVEKYKKMVDEQEAYVKARVAGTEEVKEAAWNEYKSTAYKVIADVADKEREANRKTAQEKINDLAKQMVSELYQKNLGGAELTNWTDKSLGQINDIVAKLKLSLSQVGDVIDEDLKKKAEEAGINFETLVTLMKQIIGSDISNGSIEQTKKLLTVAQTVVSSTRRITDGLASIGEASKNGFVKSLAEGLDFASDIADEILSCSDAFKEVASESRKVTDDASDIASSFSVISMVVKIAILYVEKLCEGIANTSSTQWEMVDAAREYENTLHEIAKQNYDTIFGMDELGLLAENYENLVKKAEEYTNALQTAEGKGDDAGYGNIFGGRSGIKTIQALSGFYKDIYDEAGNLNIEYMRQMRDIWDEQGFFFWQTSEGGEYYVSQDLMNQIDDLIAKYDDWKDAIDELDDSLKSLFDDLSGNLVDNLLTNFDAMGDAVADLSSSFEDMGETMLKSFLQSYILENVLNNYKERFAKMMSDYSNAEDKAAAIQTLASETGQLAEDIKSEIGTLGDAINTAIQSFKENGLYSGSESSSSTLSSGITSITEDTANLLASYINAMRADLAGHRQDVKGIATDIKQILGLLPSTPTLSEYLAQIQANTFNTARDTASILADLRSVMTSESGATSVRVLM